MHSAYLMIVCALIAVFVGLRLKAALGTRASHSPTDIAHAKRQEQNVAPTNLPPAFEKDIKELQKKIPDFTAIDFLAGAKSAFAMVLKEFSEGDLLVLRKLLADNVYDLFKKAIEARQAAGETLRNTLEELISSEIKTIAITEEAAKITVRFQSRQTHALYDKDQKLIEGNSDKINQFIDEWVFSRPLKIKPNRDAAWIVTQLSPINA